MWSIYDNITISEEVLAQITTALMDRDARQRMLEQHNAEFTFVCAKFAIELTNWDLVESVTQWATDLFGEPGYDKSWVQHNRFFYFNDEKEYMLFSLKWESKE